MADALVVGGTGMLAGLAAALVRDGWSVLTPARHRPHRSDGGTWVEADWADPDAFTAAVEHRLGGPLELLVLWCHRPYRTPLAARLEAVVTAGTLVLEVVGSSNLAALEPERLRCFPGSTLVVLGQHPGGTRWLTDREISDGVLDALLRRLLGEEIDQTVVGELP